MGINLKVFWANYVIYQTKMLKKPFLDTFFNVDTSRCRCLNLFRNMRIRNRINAGLKPDPREAEIGSETVGTYGKHLNL